jgi:NAD-dependent oxidoreductase involved in siderophore biosynthesis
LFNQLKGNKMARSHYCQVTFDADIKGMYHLDPVSSRTIATIAAARIWRNIGRKAANGYAVKRGLNMALVRLACQLEAMNKTGFVFGAI